MSVINRAELEASPLADLHALAGELGLDGFRRLRKAELIDQIVVRAGGGQPAPAASDAGGGGSAPAAQDSDGGEDGEDEDARPRRRMRGRRTRGASEPGAAQAPDAADADAAPDTSEGRGATDDVVAKRRSGSAAATVEDRVVEGVVELADNGSGFVRVSPPGASDDDVYVSAAQVRRCELVDGDRVSGPVRPPRRSERFASLLRVDTINGAAADEVAGGTRYDDLPAVHPAQRLPLGAGDATLAAVERAAPMGRGSRVVVAGAAASGKSGVLRAIAVALKDADGLDVSVVLAGVRPEEVGDWRAAGVEPVGVQTLTGSPDVVSQAVDRAVETAKRAVARGADAVVIIDSLERVHPASARKALAAARNIDGGGSLTVIASAPAPLGGETTVIALDPAATRTGNVPAIDTASSYVLRRELLG